MKNKFSYAYSQEFPYRTNHILECEFYLLENLDCCLIVYQPYRPLLQLIQDIGQEDQLLALAWRVVNDSLRTDVCLLYPPYQIALGEWSLLIDFSSSFCVPCTKCKMSIWWGNNICPLQCFISESNVQISLKFIIGCMHWELVNHTTRALNESQIKLLSSRYSAMSRNKSVKFTHIIYTPLLLDKFENI